MLNQEFDDANDDRIKLVSSVDDLKRQLQTAQQERDAANRNLSREVSYASTTQNIWCLSHKNCY